MMPKSFWHGNYFSYNFSTFLSAPLLHSLHHVFFCNVGEVCSLSHHKDVKFLMSLQKLPNILDSSSSQHWGQRRKDTHKIIGKAVPPIPIVPTNTAIMVIMFVRCVGLYYVWHKKFIIYYWLNDCIYLHAWIDFISSKSAKKSKE